MTSDIRRAQQRDIAQITNIERNCFPKPWDASTFLTILVRRGMRIQDFGFVFMNVINDEEKIEGYIVWSENLEQQEGRILNIAIKPEQRGKGLGKKLLSVTLDSMRENGITSCALEVRVSNQAARLFYEKMGMKASDRVHDYYEDEDAIIYRIDF